MLCLIGNATGNTTGNITGILSEPQFSLMRQMLDDMDMLDALGYTYCTLFVPTDDAIRKEWSHDVQDYLRRHMDAQLTNTVLYHIVDGIKYIASLRDHARLPTLQGGDLSVFQLDDGTMLLGGDINARVVCVTETIMATNGVIHVIDGVLMPSNLNTCQLLPTSATPSPSPNTVGGTDADHKSAAK